MKKVLQILISLHFCALSVVAQNCNPTLIAHWNFNNGSTTDIVNGWGSNVTGSPTITAGKNGIAATALKFNTGNYIRVASNPLMNLTSWTITASVRPDSFYAGLCQGNIIINRGDLYSYQYYGLNYSDNAYDNDCSVYTPTKDLISGGAAGPIPSNLSWNNNVNPFVQKNKWYCIVVTYDAIAGVLDQYVGGSLVVSQKWSNYYNYPTNYTADLMIGASNNPNGAWPYFFNGAIDDIRLYNGAMCADSVRCFVDVVGNDTSGHGGDTTTFAGASLGNVQLAFYPNPATNKLYITLPYGWQNSNCIALNSIGTVVYKGELNQKESSINVSDLPSGSYIFRISNGIQTINKHIIIQR